MGYLTTLGIISVIVVAVYVRDRDQGNRWMVVELAKSAATERPHLDRMCASYFEWATKANDRVPGMEKHCAKPFIEAQSH